MEAKEKGIIEWIRSIDVRYRITFFSTFFWGILSQGMGLFNKFSYHDDVNTLFGVGMTDTSGRWALEIISKMEIFLFGDGHYSIPCINGFFAILMISLAACLIVSLFRVRNQVLCSFIGGIMVAFPVITGMFGFVFTLPHYMVGMLLAVLGVYLVNGSTKWYTYLIGIVLMGSAVGIYQAHLALMLTLFLFYDLYLVMYSEMTNQQLIKKIVRDGALVLLFMAFYFGTSKLILSYKDLRLTGYQGISDVGKISLREYLHRVIFAYKEFFLPKAAHEYYMYGSRVRVVYYFVMAVETAAICICAGKRVKKNAFQTAVILLLAALIPLAVNFVFVMANPDTAHALMVYAQCLYFVLFAVMLDQLDGGENRLKRYSKNAGCALLILLTVMYCRYDNRCYMKAAFVQQESISYFTTMITQIKSADGYRDELPVCFVNLGAHEDSSLHFLDELRDIQTYPYYDIDEYIKDYAVTAYIRNWCGYSPEYVGQDAVADSQAVAQMPCYPDSGSIRVVDDIVVVKFG